MTEEQIQDIVNRVIAALEKLAPKASEPNWWEPWAAFGSYAALFAAIVAFLIGWMTLKQKREADARSEWWRRTQWALEATTDKDEQMNSYGVKMLELLSKSRMADKDDKAMLDTVWQGSEVSGEAEIAHLLGDLDDVDVSALTDEEREYYDSLVASVHAALPAPAEEPAAAEQLNLRDRIRIAWQVLRNQPAANTPSSDKSAVDDPDEAGDNGSTKKEGQSDA